MTAARMILLVVATLAVALWSMMAVRYADTYESVTSSIDPEKYRYPELFCVGFGIMNFLHISTRSKRARKRIREISEIQGKKYAEYYYYIINGAKWTYGFTVLVFFAVLGAMGNSALALFFGVILAGMIMWYLEELMNDQLNERRDELLADMPQMLSKLTLLVNSGMIVREAWSKVAYGGERQGDADDRAGDEQRPVGSGSVPEFCRALRDQGDPEVFLHHDPEPAEGKYRDLFLPERDVGRDVGGEEASGEAQGRGSQFQTAPAHRHDLHRDPGDDHGPGICEHVRHMGDHIC